MGDFATQLSGIPLQLRRGREREVKRKGRGERPGGGIRGEGEIGKGRKSC